MSAGFFFFFFAKFAFLRETLRMFKKALSVWEFGQGHSDAGRTMDSFP